MKICTVIVKICGISFILWGIFLSHRLGSLVWERSRVLLLMHGLQDLQKKWRETYSEAGLFDKPASIHSRMVAIFARKKGSLPHSLLVASTMVLNPYFSFNGTSYFIFSLMQLSSSKLPHVLSPWNSQNL